MGFQILVASPAESLAMALVISPVCFCTWIFTVTSGLIAPTKSQFDSGGGEGFALGAAHFLATRRVSVGAGIRGLIFS